MASRFGPIKVFAASAGVRVGMLSDAGRYKMLHTKETFGRIICILWYNND